jgi:DNA polymerase-3 subunit delta'
MSALASVKGQAAAVAVLERTLATGRLSTAYLFEGPSGVGKERAAMAFAAEAIAAGRPGIAERALAGGHPDLRVFRPREEGKGNIKVDFVRSEILPFAQYAPFEASEAFLVFPDADVSFPESQPESANALLKTLEEPRRGVHFLLVASRADRLLPTIRSRAQRLRFERLSPAILDAILEAEGVAPGDRGPAIALAEGRADRALALAAEGRATELLERALAVDEAVATRRPGRLLEEAEALAKDALGLEALATYYRDLACLCAGAPEGRLRFRHAREALEARARDKTLDTALASEAMVRDAMRALEGQANPQIVLDALLYRLARA